MLVSSDVSRAPKDILECEEKKSETYVQTEWEKKTPTRLKQETCHFH